MQHIKRQADLIEREAQLKWGNAWELLSARQKKAEISVIFHERVISQLHIHADVFEEMKFIGIELYKREYKDEQRS